MPTLPPLQCMSEWELRDTEGAPSCSGRLDGEHEITSLQAWTMRAHVAPGSVSSVHRRVGKRARVLYDTQPFRLAAQSYTGKDTDYSTDC